MLAHRWRHRLAKQCDIGAGGARAKQAMHRVLRCISPKYVGLCSGMPTGLNARLHACGTWPGMADRRAAALRCWGQLNPDLFLAVENLAFRAFVLLAAYPLPERVRRRGCLHRRAIPPVASRRGQRASAVSASHCYRAHTLCRLTYLTPRQQRQYVASVSDRPAPSELLGGIAVPIALGR